MPSDLFSEIRSTDNLTRAWNHVRSSAGRSPSKEIRGEADHFAETSVKALNKIQRQLREGRFQFQPSEGVLKDRKKRQRIGKDPRPLVLSQIESRIVQRAILQTLQEDGFRRRHEQGLSSSTETSPPRDPRIGRISDVIRSRFGVGGLPAPFGGVSVSIDFALSAMDDGYAYFYKSDIKSFFTKINKSYVEEFVLKETKCERTSKLFREAIDVQLKNIEEIGSYITLFPDEEIGVAQGSSLSALAGNLQLFEFDNAMNSGGTRSIRYIDDLVLFSKTEDELKRAIDQARSYLQNHKFSIYEPSDGSGKAEYGQCADGFCFLGCDIAPSHVAPSKEAVSKLLREIDGEITASKREVRNVISGKRRRIQSERLTISSTINRIGKRVYGWQKAFKFANDVSRFEDLDRKIVKKIHDLHQFQMRTLGKSPPEVLALCLGIPRTSEMPLSSIRTSTQNAF